jgi:rubrerythrin
MSKEEAIASACAGKFKHTSKANADKEIRHKKNWLASYRCPFCGFWHVGRKPDDKARDFFKNKARMWRKRKNDDC